MESSKQSKVLPGREKGSGRPINQCTNKFPGLPHAGSDGCKRVACDWCGYLFGKPRLAKINQLIFNLMKRRRINRSGRMHELSGLPTKPLPALDVLLHVLSASCPIKKVNRFGSWSWKPFGDGPSQWMIMWTKEPKIEDEIYEQLGCNQRRTNLLFSHQGKIYPIGVGTILESWVQTVTTMECYKFELLDQIGER